MPKKWNPPKPRKNGHLYQAYKNWCDFSEGPKKTKQRLSAIKKGASCFDPAIYEAMLQDAAQIDKKWCKILINYGRAVNEDLFDWLSSIKGIAEYKQVAKVIALIDDIAKFPTISKLWRYSGWGQGLYWIDERGQRIAPVIGALIAKENGKVTFPMDGDLGDYTPGVDLRVPFRPHPKPGWRQEYRIDNPPLSGFAIPYHNELKSAVWVVCDQFRRQHTPYYGDLYFETCEDEARKHPELTKGHIFARAMRKVCQIFLAHLWHQWRICEGLPVSEPYVGAVLGHTNIDYPS